MSFETINIPELQHIVSNCVIGFFSDVSVEYISDGEILIESITLDKQVIDVARADCLVLTNAADDENRVLFEVLKSEAISYIQSQIDDEVGYCDPNAQHRLGHSDYGVGGRA